MEEPRDDSPGGNGPEENQEESPPVGGAGAGQGAVEPVDGSKERPAWPSYTEDLEASVLEMGRRLADAEGALDRKDEQLREFREAAARVKEEQRARTRRLERDFQVRLERAVGEAVEGLLEVVDNLDLAVVAGEKASEVDSLLEGVRMVRESFLQSLSRQGLERMVTIGAPFDPEEAEAVSVKEVEDPAEDGVVIEEVRAGYRFKGHVLRPASVVVGSHPEAVAEGDAPAEEPAVASVAPPDADAPPEADPGSDSDHHGPAVSPAEMEFDLPEDAGQAPGPVPDSRTAPAGKPEEDEAGPDEDDDDEETAAPRDDASAALGPSVSPADIDFDEDSDSPEEPDAIDWDR